MNRIQFILCSLMIVSPVFADAQNNEGMKQVIMVAPDGFPQGSSTPEGVACDLARAFIHRDAALFQRTCIEPFGGGDDRKAYEEFLKNVAASMEREAKKDTPSPGGPKTIAKVYAARRLTLNGPASAGYAMFDFHDIKFVDVEAELVSGKKSLNRTLVIQMKDGTWRVHPAPHTASILSMGLNDEAPSTQDFSEAYTIEKPKGEPRPAAYRR